MIDFPQRRELIREAQRILRLFPDGIDGQMTWHAIGTMFLSEGHPAFRGLAPVSGRMTPEARAGIVSAVQSALRVSVDGKDGPETWGAIMDRLAPIAGRPAPYRPLGAGYPEAIRGRSPNRNKGVNERLGIIFHHCAGNFEGTISWCLRQGTYAAYHCLIGQDGQRAILGLDTDRLHHAGKSVWNGRSGCNGFMLGVAFTGNTVTGARRSSASLNVHELTSAVEWVREKQRQYGIKDSNITHHRVVSPGRKDDLSLAAWDQVKTVLGLR